MGGADFNLPRHSDQKGETWLIPSQTNTMLGYFTENDSDQRMTGTWQRTKQRCIPSNETFNLFSSTWYYTSFCRVFMGQQMVISHSKQMSEHITGAQTEQLEMLLKQRRSATQPFAFGSLHLAQTSYLIKCSSSVNGFDVNLLQRMLSTSWAASYIHLKSCSVREKLQIQSGTLHTVRTVSHWHKITISHRMFCPTVVFWQMFSADYISNPKGGLWIPLFNPLSVIFNLV